MNSWHHQLPDEHPIVSKLAEESGTVPRWGADNEDSKTPIMRNFLNACENLIGCYNKDLIFDDERRMKSYRLRKDHLAIPIKRIPRIGTTRWQSFVEQRTYSPSSLRFRNAHVP